jgi:hypothetical protein
MKKGPELLPGLRISFRRECRQSKPAVADFDHFKKYVAAV